MQQHCNALQHNINYCYTLQHTATQSDVFGTHADEYVPPQLPRGLELPAAELDNGAHEYEVDHCRDEGNIGLNAVA